MCSVRTPLHSLSPSQRFKVGNPSTVTPPSSIRLSAVESDKSMSALTPVNDQQQLLQLKKLTIKNRQGETLVGLLHETGSKELVILCHGFRSSKESITMLNLANRVEHEGISAFRFDFSGNGESEGSFAYGGYWKEAEDLRSVIEYFEQQNLSVVCIVGHSKGGGVVLLYASKYHDVKAVVNVSGRYDLTKGIMERLGPHFMHGIEKEGFVDVKNEAGSVRFRVTKDSLMDRLNTNMHDACLAIDKDCSVLTVHGSKDEVIPISDAFDFARIIPNHKLHVIDGADHCYNLHQSELSSAVIAFIKTVLRQEET